MVIPGTNYFLNLFVEVLRPGFYNSLYFKRYGRLFHKSHHGTKQSKNIQKKSFLMVSPVQNPGLSTRTRNSKSFQN